MEHFVFISRLAWPITLLLGVFHAWTIYCSHHKLENLDVSEQKIVGLKTENGFYYSYYEEMVSAPTWLAGIQAAMYDRRSEAPETINAIERFNIHQELLCGSLYRLLHWCLGGELLVEPWRFFRYCLYALNGLGYVALLALVAACGGYGLRGGLLPGATLVLLLWLHQFEISRVTEQSISNLREFWACPVLWCQTLSLFRLIILNLTIVSSKSHSRFVLWFWRVSFCTCTAGCLILWQFSAFAFVLQVSAAFLCALLSRSERHRSVVREFVLLHLISASAVACMLFFNELLVHHLLLTQCIAIFLVLHYRPRPRVWKLLFWVDGAYAVGLFLLLRLVQSRWATADDHIGEIAAAKIRKLFPSLGLVEKEPSFNARLYLAVSAFDFIDKKTIRRLMPTGLLPFGAAGALVWALAFLRQIPFAGHPEIEFSESNGDSPGKSSKGLKNGHAAANATDSAAGDAGADDADAPTATADEEVSIPSIEQRAATQAAGFAYGVLLLQILLFLALGCFIERLRVLGGPLLCVLAATAAAPRPLEALISFFGAPGSNRICRFFRFSIFVFAVVAQLGHILLLMTKLPFLEEQAKKLHADATWPDADLGELCDWMNRHIPANATIMDSMSLAGQVRALTPHRHVIHPQFESRSLRERVQEIYKIYQCTPAEEFISTMKKFRAKYLVVEYKRCDFSPFDLDQFPHLNCKGSTHPWTDLFCVRVHTSPYYKFLFANHGYAVFQIRSKRTVKDAPAQGSSMTDIATWQPMLDRCKSEDAEVCGGRIAEMASMFQEKLKKPAIAQLLFDWVIHTFPENGLAQFLVGRHYDYELKRQDVAFKYYKKAYELMPNNPFLVREYLMFLDLERQDNRTLEHLMRTRRNKQGEKLSLLELGDAALACEASVTAFQLLRDADYAEDLWELAKAHGIANHCVSSNWPLHSQGMKSLEEELTHWGMLFNIFWKRAARSYMASGQISAVRWQKPRKPWQLGVSAAFDDGR